MPPAHWTKLRKICAAVNKEKSCGRVSRSPKNAIFMWQRQRHEKAVILYRFFHPAEFSALLSLPPPQKNEKQNYALQTVPGQQAQKSLKNPENGCFLTKTTVFHGPSGETRTRGILVPKNSRNFFLIFSVRFWCFLLKLPCFPELFSPLFPRVPELSMVKNVVKTASLKSRQLFTRSRKRLSLCHCSLQSSFDQVISACKNYTAINKEKGSANCMKLHEWVCFK